MLIVYSILFEVLFALKQNFEAKTVIHDVSV